MLNFKFLPPKQTELDEYELVRFICLIDWNMVETLIRDDFPFIPKENDI